MTFGTVKQSPELDAVEKEMRRLGTGSFLGADPRRLGEILDADNSLVVSLDTTHERIASVLEEITREAKRALGDPVEPKPGLTVHSEEARGKVPCPWRDPGMIFQKGRIVLKDEKTGEVLVWTELSVHMIRVHGFYQGLGSPYRLEPAVLKRILNL